MSGRLLMSLINSGPLCWITNIFMVTLSSTIGIIITLPIHETPLLKLLVTFKRASAIELAKVMSLFGLIVGHPMVIYVGWLIMCNFKMLS